MNRVAKFEKVSYEQYAKDRMLIDLLENDDGLREEWEAIRLPARATAYSAGYDFFIPKGRYINGCPRIIATGIRCKIEPDWFLMAAPRSGLGFKYQARLANTVGIVDGDYYYSDNEGHVMIKLSSETSFMLNDGDGFAQGIFLPYGITYDDNATGIRNGGFGSTGA